MVKNFGPKNPPPGCNLGPPHVGKSVKKIDSSSVHLLRRPCIVSSEIPGDLVPRKSSGILNPQIPRKEFQDSSIPQIPGKAIQSSGKSNEESLVPKPSSSRFLNRKKVFNYGLFIYLGISETYEMGGQSGQLPTQILQE